MWVTPAKIGIIGYGIVGQAIAYGFSQGEFKNKYRILYFDKYKKSTPLVKVVKSSDFIFICLPTPTKDDESGIDLSIINEMIAKIIPLTNNTDKIVIIKSTIIPGTTTELEKKYPQTHFCFNPEFLTEANYLEDFVTADRTVIGASNDLISRKVVALYKQRFPHTKIFLTDSTSAEMVKYMANTYLAMKVIFANQIFDLCQNLNIKYEEIKEMVVADQRIVDTHLNVTSERGFGQKCFPKDIVALIGLAKKRKVNLELLETVWKINKKIRKVHDWNDIPFVISKN